ncbi:MAG: tetratricopeptide repeat protein [Thermoplasmata archaeon]|nr:tetratricopeptide repeat protein [Thermoplasmata archaeon]
MSDSVIYLCPSCGAFINEDATVCPNCNKALDEDAEDNFEKGLEELIQEDPEDLDVGQTCPRCGGKLEEDSLECASCDMKIEEELDLIGQESEDVSLFLCSGCGAFISSDSEECPSCGIPLDDNADTKEPVVEYDDELLDLLIDKEELDTEESLREMDGIGDTDELMSLIDRMADDDLDDDDDDDEPVMISIEEANDEINADHLHENLNQEVDKIRIVEGLGEKLSEEVVIDGGMEDDIRLCMECGAFVSSSSRECNVCGTESGSGKYLTTETDEVDKELVTRQKDADTESALRKILGILDETSVGSEIMEVVEEIIGICVPCGAFIPSGEDKCPVCDAPRSDMPDMPALEDIHKEETSSLSICGECGAFLRPGIGECNVCGTEVDADALDKIQPEEIIKMSQGADDSMDILKKALGVLELKDTSPQETLSGEIDLCPECGAFVSGDAKECGVCGFNFDGGIGDDMGIVIDLDEEDVKLSKNTCPNCGSRFGVGAGDCEVCGFTFLDDDLGLGELEVLESSDPAEGVDISDIIDMDIPNLEIELEEETEGLDDLAQAIEEEAIKEDQVPPPETPIPGTRMTDMEKLERLEAAYREGRLSKANYLINKAKFYGIVENMEEVEDPREDDLMDLLTDIDDTYDSIGKESRIEPEEVEYEDTDHEEIGPEPQIYEEGIYPVGEEEEEEVEYIEEDVEHIGEPVAYDEVVEYVEIGQDEEFQTRIHEAAEVRRQVPFKTFEVQGAAPRQEQTRHSGWEYGVYWSLFTSVFFVSLNSYFDLHPISLAAATGIALAFALFMMITSRSTFVRSDLTKGALFMVGGLIISFILLHWFANVIIENPQVDNILLSIGIVMIGIGMIWIRSSLRYIHLWIVGTIFLFLFSIGEMFYFDQWAFSPIQPPGTIIAGLGISLIMISTIMLAYERSLHTSIETEIVRGDIDYMNKDYKRALRSYDVALEKSRAKGSADGDTESASQQYDIPWYSKGAALILMGQLEEGIECLDMALSINPNNEVAWVSKGNAYSKLGDSENAIESYNNALISNPRYIIAWNNRGNAFARRKDYVEALSNYNRAIKLNPNYHDAWINKGYVLMKMGKQEEALKCVSMIDQRGGVEQPKTAASSA